MMKVKLGDIFEISSGGTPSKLHPEYYGGSIPWVKTGDLKNKYLYKVEDYITEEGLNSSSTKIYEEGTVLIAMYGATIGATSILKMSACTNQACAAFKKNDKVIPEYLYYFLRSQKNKFSKDGVGGAQPNISARYLKKVEIEMLSLNKQKEIINILDMVSDIICKKNYEIQVLDELVKARFVELFGEPNTNPYGWMQTTVGDVCEIIDGDRGKNYPKADDFSDKGYCLFLNAKNVTSSGFNFDDCVFISKEKDEAMRKGKLSRGDVVLTTRGTIGNLAFYTDDILFENVRINSGMVIIRIKRDILDEIYFIEQFKMQLSIIKEKIASGSAQPQLPISTMNKIQILIPTIQLQNQFADFVSEVDKSREIVQKKIDAYQELFDKLMQEYFG